MTTRRDFLQIALATAAVTGLGGQLSRVAAQQALTRIVPEYKVAAR